MRHVKFFADSPELNGLLVVPMRRRNMIRSAFTFTEAWASLKTDEYLIKEDKSLKTLWNFIKGRDYFKLQLTAQLHQENRFTYHLPCGESECTASRGCGKLMDDAIRYAGEHRMMISLETHNEKNVAFYAHFGFKVFGSWRKAWD